jgi:para-nitrobenzyl esterase
MRMTRRSLMSSMVSTLVAAPLIPQLASASSDFVVARTRLGPVRGVRVDGINAFKGIPYGAGTSGEARFLRAKPPKPWTQPRDALEYGPACAQSDPTLPKRRVPEPESEDCLTLNVWSPALRDGRKRPVMVWLHGGGLWALSAAGEGQAGHSISRRGDVVFVSPNHRIGVFGLAPLEQLDPEAFPAASHLAMLDLVMALEWVRDNIEEFGGDPGNVTILGQSGGGQKVSLLMAMPAAQGLFHKAIIQSGPMPVSLSPAYARTIGERLLDKLSISPAQIRRVHSLTTEEILKGYFALLREIGGYGVMGIVRGVAPVVDGVNLPQQPFWYRAPEISEQVPLLIGNTRTEMTGYTLSPDPLLYQMADPNAYKMNFTQIESKLAEIFAADAPRIVSDYRRSHPNASPWEIYSLILSDWPTRLFSVHTADVKVKQGAAPVFVYRMDWQTQDRDGLLMSPHAIDIQFVLDTTHARSGGQVEERRHMANQMSEAWIAFARTGNPNHSGIPEWPRYNMERRPTMLFNLSSRVVEDPDGDDLRSLKKNMSAYEVVAGGLVPDGK